MNENINYEYITEYIREITPESSELLSELEEYAKENNVPIIDKETSQFIRTMMKITRPKKILEIGTAIGYSALLMAEAYNGSDIVTIERDKNMVKLAVDNIESSIYADRINLMQGDASEILEEMKEKYDFVFIDAAKGQYKNFFDKIKPLLSESAIIISDNILFKGMVANDRLVNKRVGTIVRRLREYLEYINSLEGYTTSVIPLGDGVAITYREE